MFGVAVLAAVFARNGSYASPQTFVDGMVPAVLIGSVFVAIGAVAAFAIPSTRRVDAEDPGFEEDTSAPVASRGGKPEPAYTTIEN